MMDPTVNVTAENNSMRFFPPALDEASFGSVFFEPIMASNKNEINEDAESKLMRFCPSGVLGETSFESAPFGITFVDLEKRPQSDRRMNVEYIETNVFTNFIF